MTVDVFKEIESRFVSGNSVPVTRTHITSTEWNELKKLLVTNIMIDVVPGDGSGCEVYAKSVEDIEMLISKMSLELDESNSKKADVDSIALEAAREIWQDINLPLMPTTLKARIQVTVINAINKVMEK